MRRTNCVTAIFSSSNQLINPSFELNMVVSVILIFVLNCGQDAQISLCPDVLIWIFVKRLKHWYNEFCFSRCDHLINRDILCWQGKKPGRGLLENLTGRSQLIVLSWLPGQRWLHFCPISKTTHSPLAVDSHSLLLYFYRFFLLFYDTNLQRLQITK